ncbi:MAG: hypothetical protein WC683_01005 [bacterium]
MILTHGEKMVWAAAFIAKLQLRQPIPVGFGKEGTDSKASRPVVAGMAYATVKDKIAEGASDAAAYACAVVRVLRTAHLEGTDDSDFQMLRAMLGDEG